VNGAEEIGPDPSPQARFLILLGGHRNVANFKRDDRETSAHPQEMQHDQNDCDKKNNVYQRTNGLLQNQKPEQPEDQQDASNDQQHGSASR